MSDGAAVLVALGTGFLAAFLFGVAITRYHDGIHPDRRPPWLRAAMQVRNPLAWVVAMGTFLVVYGVLRAVG